MALFKSLIRKGRSLSDHGCLVLRLRKVSFRTPSIGSERSRSSVQRSEVARRRASPRSCPTGSAGKDRGKPGHSRSGGGSKSRSPRAPAYGRGPVRPTRVNPSPVSASRTHWCYRGDVGNVRILGESIRCGARRRSAVRADANERSRATKCPVGERERNPRTRPGRGRRAGPQGSSRHARYSSERTAREFTQAKLAGSRLETSMFPRVSSDSNRPTTATTSSTTTTRRLPVRLANPLRPSNRASAPHAVPLDPVAAPGPLAVRRG